MPSRKTIFMAMTLSAMNAVAGDVQAGRPKKDNFPPSWEQPKRRPQIEPKRPLLEICEVTKVYELIPGDTRPPDKRYRYEKRCTPR